VLPFWLRQPAPIKAPETVTVSPSTAFEDETSRGLPGVGLPPAERRKALGRGRIVHRLLQALPEIPDAARKEAIARYLKNAAAEFVTAEQAEMTRQVLAILNDLVFAEAFAPGSRAEVPIVGRLVRAGAPAVAVSGQVDRLAVTAEAVLIVDYKTDRTPPRTLAEVPPPYVAQLSLYRAVLARIYPEKTIRAALIFADGPTLIEVSAVALETALAEIMGRVTLG